KGSTNRSTPWLATTATASTGASRPRSATHASCARAEPLQRLPLTAASALSSTDPTSSTRL
ncbi:hypothetical protein HK405_007773, partial [Cladochytrium tenue]